ncbi:MAG: histidine--tRNA ligase family protein, partial [Clostridia bacterium]|nr:histidine--tRNA ligase family protein [Clostridia bacterium]
MSDNLNKSENKIIEPSILAGFQEYLPREQMLFTKMLDIIKKSFESYGFIPLDTPVLEKADILLAKSGGETGKQIYRFEKGDTDMAMRFDLTVPLARYVAQHCGELVFPFRRYHIGKVYRGERPQKGRFREFYQCDIDIVGSGSLSLLSEAEIVSVINATFEALNIGEFTIMINNRKLLGGYFASLGVDDPTEALRIVDKLDKIGAEKVRAELCELGLSPDAAASILNVTSMCGAPAEVLDKLEAMRADVDNELFDTGLDELRRVCTAIREFGVPASRFAVNLKIARGLDYYTGTVYETLL